MGLPDLRFAKADMHNVLVQQGKSVADAVRKIDADLVLATPVQDLADRLYEKYRVEPIRLMLDRRTSSGAKDLALRVDSWTGEPITVDGTRVEVLIPFEGDAILFDPRPSLLQEDSADRRPNRLHVCEPRRHRREMHVALLLIPVLA